MHKIGLLLITNNYKQNLSSNCHTSAYIQNDSGFSLVEMVAVTLIVGILALIALPNWLGFMNRQQVGKANDAVLAALQQAQREAKQKKLGYSVSFKVENQVSKIAVHPDSITGSNLDSNQWKSINESTGMQSGKITFFTNLDGKNTANTTTNSPVNPNPTYLNNPQTITFDYMGTLPNANFGTVPTGSTEAPGLKIVVATPNGAIKRCVIVKTLLGSTITARDNQCN